MDCLRNGVRAFHSYLKRIVRNGIAIISDKIRNLMYVSKCEAFFGMENVSCVQGTAYFEGCFEIPQNSRMMRSLIMGVDPHASAPGSGSTGDQALAESYSRSGQKGP